MRSLNYLGILLYISLFLCACGGGGGGATGVPTEVAAAPTPPDTAPETGAPEEAPPVPRPVDEDSVTLFESGQVRPVALSPSGKRLFVANTPDGRLEIFDITPSGLTNVGSVTVGLDPVAVAARSEAEVWVVNHLSDSVSIVRFDGGNTRVSRTLLVGDEPRDIVFAGEDNSRAFITAAFRGQNHPSFNIKDLKTPGIGRADVWVFDVNRLGTELGGKPLNIVNLFADTPRALARSPDGSRVYAAAFLSGNQTTTLLNEEEVAEHKPPPFENEGGAEQPATGLIVGFDGSRWVDESGKDWSDKVMFDLPDFDVFVLDASAELPQVIQRYSGVGTVLFNAVTNPVTGALYVSNTEALNRVRFEGPGETASTVRGHFVENRVSVVRDGRVVVNHLNPHVDFSLPEGQGIAPAEKQKSLAQPMEMVVSPDGATLYLAAFGSNKVAAIASEKLEKGEYQPDPRRQVIIPGGGPAGLVLSPDGERLYVLSRYGNSVTVIDTSTLSPLQTVNMFDPEPAKFRRGRRLLYDAQLTSSNGTASCGGCHLFGDLDGLAWDLGDPDGRVTDNPNEFVPLRSPTQGVFHPMKGPMTTQTLRGIADSGPMHWRGDRTGQNPAVVNGRQESLEAAAFKEFNPAFVGLLGRETELADDLLQDFTDFALAIVPPPNPIRALDNQLTSGQAEGRRIFMDDVTTGGALTCNHCHVLDVAQKQFGTAGLMTNEGPGITEDFKVAHLRNVYAKVGMFGESVPRPGQQEVHMGDQIRGFGLLHDGGIDTVSNFLTSSVFAFASDSQREQVVDFVFAFDSNVAPVVGQQVTIDVSSSKAAHTRLDLLVERASVGDCDLIVKGVIDGEARGALLLKDGNFRPDRRADASVTMNQLLSLAKDAQNALTFTCTPPGSGERMGIDRNLDSVLDGD